MFEGVRLTIKYAEKPDYLAFVRFNALDVDPKELMDREFVREVMYGMNLAFPNNPMGGISTPEPLGSTVFFDVHFPGKDGEGMQQMQDYLMSHYLRGVKEEDFIVKPVEGSELVVVAANIRHFGNLKGYDAKLEELMKEDPNVGRIHRVSGFRAQPNMDYRSDGHLVVVDAGSYLDAYELVRSVAPDTRNFYVTERREITDVIKD